MAVPVKPVRQHSFTMHSQTEPDQPHDGDKLDIEIDSTNQAVADVLDFARQVIADDGTVKSAAVENAFTEATQGPKGDDGAPGVNFVPDELGVTADRTQWNAEPKNFSFLDTTTGTIYWKVSDAVGDWSPGAAYGQGPAGADGVDGTNGTNGTNGVDGVDGADGQPGMRPRGEWDNATAYAIGDVVSVGTTVIYQCIQAHTNRDPATEPLFWIKLLENAAFQALLDLKLEAPAITNKVNRTAANGAIELPAGTTEQRPAGDPAVGIVWRRYNTETPGWEVNLGSGWEAEASGGAWELITKVEVTSNVGAVDLTQFDNTKYDFYQVIFSNVKPVSDDRNFLMRVSTDGGATFEVTNVESALSYGGSIYNTADTSSGQFVLGLDVGRGTNEDGISGVINIHQPEAAFRTLIHGHVAWINIDNNDNGGVFHGFYAGGDTVNALRFLFNSGDISHGNIRLIGLKL